MSEVINEDQELRRLARQVIQILPQEQDVDIDMWARKLAEDIANATD